MRLELSALNACSHSAMQMLFVFTNPWICYSISLQSAVTSRLALTEELFVVCRVKGLTFLPEVTGQSTFRELIGSLITSANLFCSAFMVTGFTVYSYKSKTSSRVRGTLIDKENCLNIFLLM